MCQRATPIAVRLYLITCAAQGEAQGLSRQHEQRHGGVVAAGGQEIDVRDDAC